MLLKEHIFVDFGDCTFFMAKVGEEAVFREGVKFSKSLEMAGSFFKCSRILGGAGDKLLECCFKPCVAVLHRYIKLNYVLKSLFPLSIKEPGPAVSLACSKILYFLFRDCRAPV